jgi:transcriptional regulator with XRE-family HTH domain
METYQGFNDMSDFEYAPVEGDGLLSISARERRNKIKQVLGDALTRELSNAGMTQKDLATKTGMQEYEVSRYVLGKSTAKPAKVEAMAKAIGISPDKLVPGYVSKQMPAGMAIQFKKLDTGNVWVEFSGAFDQDTTSKLLEIMSKVQIGENAG